MNEQSQKILSDLLQRAVSGIDAAVGFSQAQIPDVINQLLMWQTVSSILAQVICLALISISIWGAIKAWASNDVDTVVVTLIFGGILTVICLAVFSLNFDWLKILIAPKLYLLEYAASIVSK